MPDDTWHTNILGKTPSYTLFLQYREARDGEDALKAYIEFPGQRSVEDVLGLIGDEGWELAWMSADQKELYVKRPHAKLGNFIIEEKFK